MYEPFNVAVVLVQDCSDKLRRPILLFQVANLTALARSKMHALKLWGAVIFAGLEENSKGMSVDNYELFQQVFTPLLPGIPHEEVGPGELAESVWRLSWDQLNVVEANESLPCMIHAQSRVRYRDTA